MINRAEFFRRLLTGAVVAPIVAGEPRLDLTTEIIRPESAKPIEVYQESDIPKFRPMTGKNNAILLYEGHVFHLGIVDLSHTMHTEQIDITSFGDSTRRYMDGHTHHTLRLDAGVVRVEKAR